jgi:outer membrane protein TolC
MRVARFHLTFLPLIASTCLASAQSNEMPARRLSLAEAMDLAATANVDVQIATERIREAGGHVTSERALLLPTLKGGVSQNRQDRSTAAFGLPSSGSANVSPVQNTISYPGTPNSVVKQFDLPTTALVTPVNPVPLDFDFSDTTGPYNYFNAKLYLTVPLIDVQNFRSVDAATAEQIAARLDRDAAREEAMSQAASLYQGVNFSQEAVDMLTKKVELHEQRVVLSEDLAKTGVSTELDVRKEKVVLAQVRTELRHAQNQLAMATRELKRVLDIDPAEGVELTDALNFRPMTALNPGDAFRLALERRPEYRSQKQKEKAASIQRKSAIADYYPTLKASGNYGESGLTPDDTVETWFIGAAATIPLFDSFKRRGTIIQRDSKLKQERSRTRDMEDRMGNEVRQSADELGYYEAMVLAADENVMYSDEVLHKTRDGEQAGTTTELDVVEAEVDLANAKYNRLEAMYNYDLSVTKWFKATGNVREAALERETRELWNPGPDANAEETQDGAEQGPP